MSRQYNQQWPNGRNQFGIEPEDLPRPKLPPIGIEFLVKYGGGRGPDAWDSRIKVTANSFLEAVETAKLELSDVLAGDADIYSLSKIGCGDTEAT